MRIALFILPSDRIGGAERIVCNLAREAARSRAFDKVEIFVVSGPPSGTLEDLKKQCAIKLRYGGASGVSAGVIPLLRALARCHYDLVFSSSAQVNAVISFARKIRILRTRRLITRESTMLFERNFGWRSRMIWLLLRGYGSQDLIVCQTEAMKSSLDYRTGGRLKPLLKVYSNPIDSEMIAAGKSSAPPAEVTRIPHDCTKIVWCGRLEKVKSPERAIATLAALHASGERNMYLVMIGDGSLRSELEQQVAKTGLGNHVIFTGNHALPCSIMSHCDLGLVTSDVEGFPNVVLEMLASGVSRIISTDCAGGLDKVPGVSVVPVTPQVVSHLSEALLAQRGAAPDPRTHLHLQRRNISTYLAGLLSYNSGMRA